MLRSQVVLDLLGGSPYETKPFFRDSWPCFSFSQKLLEQLFECLEIEQASKQFGTSAAYDAGRIMSDCPVQSEQSGIPADSANESEWIIREKNRRTVGRKQCLMNGRSAHNKLARARRTSSCWPSHRLLVGAIILFDFPISRRDSVSFALRTAFAPSFFAQHIGEPVNGKRRICRAHKLLFIAIHRHPERLSSLKIVRGWKVCHFASEFRH